MFVSRDDEPRHSATYRRPRAERVGVDAGEERPERRSDRHEQQQHIADTRLRQPSGLDLKGPPDVTAVRPARPHRTRGRRAFRAPRVRPVGHGPVCGHSRVEKAVARPTAGRGGRRYRGPVATGDGHCDCAPVAAPGTRRYRGSISTSGDRRYHGNPVAGPSVRPVPVARRPIGHVRLQAAAAANEHGGWTTRATVGRGQAPAASTGAAADVDATEDRAGRGREKDQRRRAVEVGRALLDNTGRLS